MQEVNFMDQYLDLFYAEAREQLETLSRNLLAVETTGATAEVIHEMFRAAHSLKGASAMAGFNGVAALTHKVEDLLGVVRTGRQELSSQGIDAIFDALDYIQANLFAGESDPGRESYITGRLEAGLPPVVAAEKSGQAGPGEPPVYGGEWGDTLAITITFEPDCSMKALRAFLLVNNLQDFGEVVRTNPPLEELESNETAYAGITIFLRWEQGERQELEAAVNINDVQEFRLAPVAEPVSQVSSPAGKPMVPDQGDKPATLLPGDESPEDPVAAGLTRPGATPAKGIKGGDLIKVEAGRLDNLMNLIGELHISQARFARIQQNYLESQGITVIGTELTEEAGQLSRITTQLQDGLMKARMVPVGTVFNRFPRIVRDLAKKQHKQIDLVIEGKDTELDKSVVDQIGEPLMHLVRNAVDHGIESPAARQKAGKSATGRICLTAAHEGSQIVIKVSDDGKGINEQKVLAKGKKLGLVGPDQELTRQEILNLIFSPGFSTAETVTDLSGRGVGMDVVKSTIVGLNGLIDIQSELERGTVIAIKLPITLAIIQGLLVQVEAERMIIPLDNVLESFQLRPGELRTVNGQQVFPVRGSVVPVRRLQEFFQIPPAGEKPRRKYHPVVMVGLAEQRMGLAVDELLGQREIVIKAVNASWLNLEKFAGATILDDGRVALILNVAAIFA